MNIEELKNWSKKHNIDSRTKAGFLNWFNNFRNEEPEEYEQIMEAGNVDELLLELHTVSLNLGHWPDCSYITISAALRVFMKDKQLFNYKSSYTLDGLGDDDFVDFLN